MSSQAASATALLYTVESATAESLRPLLESHGMSVVHLRSAEDAQRSLLLHPGALYLVEVQADDEVGIAIIRAVGARDSSATVVVLSSEAEQESRQAARVAGAHDYLATPVRSLDLEMCLARVLSPVAGRSESTDPTFASDAEPLREALAHARTAEQEALALLEKKKQELLAAKFRNEQLQRQNQALLEHARSRASAPPAPSISGDAPRSDIDELTGLLAGEPLQDHLDREYARSRRYGHALSVLLIDVDRLGRFSKRHGKAAGDSALGLVADVLRAALRTPDIVARQDSDAFVIVATDTTEDEALQLGNRLRAALADESQHASFPGVTVSIGIASAKRLSVTRASDLLAAAERAMAEAKSAGRDCCRVAVA